MRHSSSPRCRRGKPTRCSLTDETTPGKSSVAPWTPSSRNPLVTTSRKESYSSTDDNTEKRHFCEFENCGRSFKRQYSKNEHHKTHTGERPYQCSECLKRFSTSGNLSRHRKIHAIPKSFLCPVMDCGQAFASAMKLKTHSKQHFSAKPHTCPVKGCGRDFATAGNLSRHMKMPHADETVKMENKFPLHSKKKNREKMTKSPITTTHATATTTTTNTTIQSTGHRKPLKLSADTLVSESLLPDVISELSLSKTPTSSKREITNSEQHTISRYDESNQGMRDESNNPRPRKRSMILDIPRVENVPRIDDTLMKLSVSHPISSVFTMPEIAEVSSIPLVDYDTMGLSYDTLSPSTILSNTSTILATSTHGNSQIMPEPTLEPYQGRICNSFASSSDSPYTMSSQPVGGWIEPMSEFENILKQHNVFDGILAEDWSEHPCNEDVFSVACLNGYANGTSFPYVSDASNNKNAISSATLSA